MRSDGNHLFFEGSLGGDPLPALAALYNITKKQGFSDVILDFKGCTFLSPEFMLPLVTICRSYRHSRVDFELIMPDDAKLAALLVNTNWANLIIPEKYEEKSEKNVHNLSARQYFTADEHDSAVDASLELLLNVISGIDRSRLKALEWALNEITDNVLNHSESPIGGIMQVMTFPKKGRADFFVCDAGITIPRSLKSGRADLQDDVSALRAAIEEGVTKNKSTNQGNGLYGTFKCCEVSGGDFDIISGSVYLKYRPNDLRVGKNQIPFSGTYVRASIDYNYEKLLEKALVFKGKCHNPSFDYVDRVYQPNGKEIKLSLESEINAFGSREAGLRARTKIENLMDNFTNPVNFDFRNVKLISSSFADEVFGKLFVRLGPVRFTQLCRFQNIDPTVQGLIDRAIAQRVRL